MSMAKIMAMVREAIGQIRTIKTMMAKTTSKMEMMILKWAIDRIK